MIRLFALLLTVTFAFNAHANVKRPGTVQKNFCTVSITTSSPARDMIPHEVCLATVVGNQMNYLTLDNQLWLVVSHAPQYGGEALKLQLVGVVNNGMVEHNLNLALISADGFIKGQNQATRLLFVQSRSRTFHAVNFQMLFHTM